MNKEFHVEGNNGGDYLKLKETGEEGMIHLEIGHCCVITFKGEVPVEVLTSMLSQIFDSGVLQLPWAREFNEKLLAKIVKE